MEAIEKVQNKIFEIRGCRVMLDFDLAALYQVGTKRLKEQVKRNSERFPPDFMFQLTENEWRELVAICDQFPATLKHSHVLPTAFTEQGVAMLSAVLRSAVAVQTSLMIMRAFVYMRRVLARTGNLPATIREIEARLALLEHRCDDNLEAVNDLSEDVRKDLDALYEAIGALSVKLPQAPKSRRPIGFKK